MRQSPISEKGNHNYHLLLADTGISYKAHPMAIAAAAVITNIPRMLQVRLRTIR